MKQIKCYLVPVMALLLALFSCSREYEIVTLTTSHLSVGINSKGYINSLKDLNSNTDYIAKMGLHLPGQSDLTRDDVLSICDVVRTGLIECDKI